MQHIVIVSALGALLTMTACGQVPDGTTLAQQKDTTAAEWWGDPVEPSPEAGNHCPVSPQDPNVTVGDPSKPAVGDPGAAIDGNGKPVPHPDGPAADPNRSPESPIVRGCDPNGY